MTSQQHGFTKEERLNHWNQAKSKTKINFKNYFRNFQVLNEKRKSPFNVVNIWRRKKCLKILRNEKKETICENNKTVNWNFVLWFFATFVVVVAGVWRHWCFPIHRSDGVIVDCEMYAFPGGRGGFFKKYIFFSKKISNCVLYEIKLKNVLKWKFNCPPF